MTLGEQLASLIARANESTGEVELAQVEPWTLALGCAAADHAVYHGDDRCGLSRMFSVVQAFPEGFRLWTCKGVPVGYAAWYPIDAPTYHLLRTVGPPQDRAAIVPVTAARAHAAYIFNYSMLPALRPAGSGRMLADLTARLDALGSTPRCALTVSADGARVAARWGLSRRRGGVWTSP